MAAMDETLQHQVLPQRLVPQEDRRSLYSLRESYRHQTVRILSLAMILMAVVLVCVLAWTFGVYRASVGRQPLTVGIDQTTGAAYVLRPESLQMRLTDQVLRHFLLKWTEDHFERLTIGEPDYRKSLQFMSSKLTGTGGPVDGDLKEFEQVRRGEIDEVSIRPLNAVISNDTDVIQHGCTDDAYRKTGRLCTGLVQFEKHFISPSRESESRVISAVVEVQFVMLSNVPESLVAVNPLGFVITGFHVSEATQ